MNREQRRNMEKKSGGELRYLDTPCTITEAVQIARGVAEDVLSDYQQRSGHLQVAISLQMEILKDVVIKAGLVSEEEFKEKYIQQAEIFNNMQQAAMESMQTEDEEESVGSPKMETSVRDIEVKSV